MAKKADKVEAAPKKEKKPVATKKPVKKKEEKPEEENFRGIVRIAGKDVKGERKLVKSLLSVTGISHTMAVSAARAISEKLKIDPNTRVGDLSELQVDAIDKVLFSLSENSIPKYLFNRRGDYESGEDKHTIMNDLIFNITQDVERAKKSFTWKGFRHTFGHKVRGQRTKNTGRHGMAVGVLRKSIVAQTGAKPAAGAAQGAKPAKK